MDENWPEEFKDVLRACWSREPYDRPTISEVRDHKIPLEIINGFIVDS